MYPKRVLLNCFARTYCINAAKTARGMQQTGLIFVLEPALRWLYPAPDALARALARYGGHSNTHPFMIPLFVGILLALEEAMAKGSLPQGAVQSVRETLATSLSALGDSFFSGALLPLWALTSTLLLLSGLAGWTAALAVALFCLLLAFRALCFVSGLRHGMPVLMRLKRLNLINWVDRLKMLNALLAALLVWQVHQGGTPPLSWAIYVPGVAAVLGAAWLVGRLRLPRLLLWTMVLGALILMDAGLIHM